MGRKRTKLIQPTPFGEKLLELRGKRQLERQALGQAVEVSATYIGMLEHGERQPSRELVLRLGQVLCPADQAQALDELLLLAGFSPLTPPAPEPQDLLAIHTQALADNQHNFKAFSALVLAQCRAGLDQEAQQLIQQGFQRFHEHIQLQSLLAMLELSRGQYDDAISTQALALEQYRRQPDKGPGTSEANLLLNLGALYFLKGCALLTSAQDQAREALQQACQHLQQAVLLAPEDIYILDEYARASCNLATALPAEQSLAQWQHTLAAFRAVLDHPQRDQLGQPALREASLFLGLAYAKCGNFEAAQLSLSLVQALSPADWLLHYLQACCLCLQYAQSPAPDLLQRALEQLAQAAGFQTPDNRTCSEAPTEPDFAPLRQHCQADFAKLFK